MSEKNKSCESAENADCSRRDDCNNDPCPTQPGTILRIFIPAGAVVNLLNLIEVSSPGGICIIVRLPFLSGSCGNVISTVFKAVKEAGGSIDFVK